MKPAVLMTHMRGCDEMGESLLMVRDVEIIIAYDDIAPYLEHRGIPFRRFFDFLSESASRRAVVESTVRAEEAAKTLAGEVVPQYFPGMTKATQQRIATAFETRFRDDFLHECLLVDCLHACARETDLRAIVVPQDICRDTKTLTLAAKSMAIPVVHLLHAYPYGADNLHEEWYADYVAVFSEEARKLYEGFGVPPGRICVTGNPYWDNLCRPPRPALRKKGFEASGFDANSPVIVHGLTYIHELSAISASHPEYARQTLEASLKAYGNLSKKYPEWQFILRPHPNMPDHYGDLNVLAESAGIKRFFVDCSLAPAAVCAMADVVLCTQSNLGIEAMLYGVPAINLVIDAFAKPVFDEGMGRLFQDDDAIVSVNKVEDIEPAVERLVLDQNARAELLAKRPATIERFNGGSDRSASARFTEFLLYAMDHGVPDRAALPASPQFVSLLAAMVPASALRILVYGEASTELLRAIRQVSPLSELDVEHSLHAELDAAYDAIFVAEPLTQGPTEVELFAALGAMLRTGGCLVAAALNGAYSDCVEAMNKRAWAPIRPGAKWSGGVGGYCLNGLSVNLSRASLAFDKVEGYLSQAMAESGAAGLESHAVEAWVFRALWRDLRRQPEAFVEAAKLNRAGEAAFEAGDVSGALEHFRAAIASAPEEGLYYNNLGTALFAADSSEAAWDAFIHALHYAPTLANARDNLEAAAAVLGRDREARAIIDLLCPLP